jgi:hypothetical protein
VGVRNEAAGDDPPCQLDGHRHAGYNRKAGLGKP